MKKYSRYLDFLKRKRPRFSRGAIVIATLVGALGAAIIGLCCVEITRADAWPGSGHATLDPGDVNVFDILVVTCIRLALFPPLSWWAIRGNRFFVPCLYELVMLGLVVYKAVALSNEGHKLIDTGALTAASSDLCLTLSFFSIIFQIAWFWHRRTRRHARLAGWPNILDDVGANHRWLLGDESAGGLNFSADGGAYDSGAYASGGAGGGDLHRERLERLLAENDSAQLPLVEQLLQRHQGREQQLFRDLEQRYGVSSDEAVEEGQAEAEGGRGARQYNLSFKQVRDSDRTATH